MALLAALTGCGGGGGGNSAPSASHSRAQARFDVNLATGKVSVSSADGRAIYQGGAVSFASSDLLMVGGDAGKRVIHVTATNHSGETWGGAPVNLTVSGVANASAAAIRSNVKVSTFAGTLGLSSESEGYRTSAGIGTPWGIGSGQGPMSGSLFVGTIYSLRRILPDGMVSTMAGLFPTNGFADGAGGAARFNNINSVASDSAGNLYVTDATNHRIRRVSPLGHVTTIAGTGVSGLADGTGATATFAGPWGIAVSPSGSDIYVVDYTNCNIRLVRYRAVTAGPRELATSYDVTTLAGPTLGGAGWVDGAGSTARFSNPRGVTLVTEPSGIDALFVADGGNHVIRRISPLVGAVTVSTVAGDGVQGETDGSGAVARFRYPMGISAAPIDQGSFGLYVTDNNHVRLIAFVADGSPTQKGSYNVLTLAGGSASGYTDGDGNVAQFSLPYGITAVGSGSGATLYVADAGNAVIRKVDVPGGALHTGGQSSAVIALPRMLNWDAEAPNGGGWIKRLSGGGAVWSGDIQFNVPEGVSGFSFLACISTDSSVMNLPAVGASTLSTVAGNGAGEYADGPGREARFYYPRSVVAVPSAMRGLYRSPSGAPIMAFVADTWNQRIRYIDTGGYVGLWAGSVVGYADGVASSACFNYPMGLALYPDGSLIVSELHGVVRRVWPNQQVTTVAGLSGTYGAVDGTGDVARFGDLEATAVTPGGRIYVADTLFNTIRRIALVGSDPRSASSYSVETVAGSTSSSGFVDGAGTIARFYNPAGLAADSDGRVYVADSLNNAVRVLTPGSGGVTVTTISAGLSRPYGLCVDPAHSVYVGDSSSRIFRVSPDSARVTVAGTGVSGFADGPSGSLSAPTGLAMLETGDMLVADINNCAVRRLSRIVDTAAP